MSDLPREDLDDDADDRDEPDSGGPWAKTSSGDAESVTTDDEDEDEQ